ncbi:hypothetical protein [Tychonema sp. LEGE 07203]|uniref:hypothetical protein n=1 Tax=Tychonema sp. LEGE 07203 TaxID=1828671 RepID=UPI00187EE29E|nr:hypothetical protein [Tychonema sp. LEGE 07203]MBE9093833.1 hypothetical protein [Tychonema sp. LEGE 07203]
MKLLCAHRAFKKIFSSSRSYHWRSQPAKSTPNLAKCQTRRSILDLSFGIKCRKSRAMRKYPGG